ncbi:MAG: ATP-dependent DNA helicase [Actinomycetota bacterium]|nr:ATP-dependent DNA helicase [Actinomycetota bacterium]
MSVTERHVAAETLAVLQRTTAALPRCEDRPGQQQMAGLVARCLAEGGHLVVQAGTGTGKSLAYLVPAIVSRRRVVVVTATKALQDQLARKDLPFLAEASGIAFDHAVLKGRSNYLCRQRLDEVTGSAQAQLDLEGITAVNREQISRLATWADQTESGDIADLDWSPADSTWRSLSVSSDECPGATRCPRGDDCFAENARRRAMAADVTVVNMHLYGIDIATDGAILPEHEVVVIDEAHLLEDVISDTVGVQVTPGQFRSAAAVLRRIIDDPRLVGALADAGQLVHDELQPRLGDRLGDDDELEALVAARLRIDAGLEALAAVDNASDDVKQRRLRAQNVLGALAGSLDAVAASGADDVRFVSGTPVAPRLVQAPLNVAPVLKEHLWSRRVAVLTSATIPASLPRRLGLDDVVVHDVGSPFDYEHHGLLYCAVHLPDPRADGYRDLLHAELGSLITAAGGRTLALFTSWRAMEAAAAAVSESVDLPILTQGQLPKPSLLERFAADEATCLFATVGLFQGVDIPGRTLSLVTIDRLPFPRPDDPLLQARRELLGRGAFGEIDVPRAAMLLAQASGRLIRTAQDRGAVAVFDRRLATARYRWQIVNALPPMRRTKHLHEIESFLRHVTTNADSADIGAIDG